LKKKHEKKNYTANTLLDKLVLEKKKKKNEISSDALLYILCLYICSYTVFTVLYKNVGWNIIYLVNLCNNQFYFV
jgi:hypothetical protein